MTTPIPDKKIYFLGDTAEIISDILKKYGIEETDEDLAKKIFGEKPFIIRGGVVLKYATSLAKKEINENEITASLVKELNISQTIAEGITNEIKNRLIPIATTEKPIPKQQNVVENIVENEPVINIKPPIGIPPIGEAMKKTEEYIPKIDSTNTVSIPETKKNNIEKPKIEKYKKSTIKENPPTQGKKEQKKGDDTYREAI